LLHQDTLCAYNGIAMPNGHDIAKLAEALKAVKGTDHPVVVHVCTQKGKGFEPAEKDREKAGRQFVDLGICEQNAVSFTAAMARGGCKAIYATNSTFIQRAYDQIEQEMCMTPCPMTLIVTHGSVYGHWNDVQNGMLDIALLSNIPHLTYLAPATKEEYLAMLDWSIEQNRIPVAIRMPGSAMLSNSENVDSDYFQPRFSVKQKGSKVAVIALGGFYSLGEETVKLYEETIGEKATLINPRFIGCDSKTLEELKKDHSVVVTVEDGILSGGFGEKIAAYYANSPMRVLNYGFGQDIPVKYNPGQLMEQNRLTPSCIVDDIKSALTVL